MSSERADALATFCGLCDAEPETLALVELAQERDRDTIVDGWDDADIARALSALESCAYLGCHAHRDEYVPRLLRGILDELGELQRDPDAPDCDCGSYCTRCTPGIRHQ